MESIFNYDLKNLEQKLIEIGQKKFRAKQILEWIYSKNVYNYEEMSNLSKDLRETLNQTFSLDLFEIVQKQESKDGTVKYLLRLDNNGGFIETVLMRHNYGQSLCVTSQLGCNMGCKFCASGLLKKQRNLEAHEIVRQVLTVSKDLNIRISHLVVMGTGEPFDNYDNVMKFIRVINDPFTLAIGARHITVSTCGIVPKINQFAEEGIQVNLAISLHAPNDEIRDQIMPINQAYPMDMLRDSIKNYIEKTNRRVTLEYILLDHVNDELVHARQLAHYLRGLNVYVNLIPYNSVDEHGFKKSKPARVEAFKDELLRLHINCTLRKEHGSDIDGACGQLRAKKEGRL